jgi:hypothetical protein
VLRAAYNTTKLKHEINDEVQPETSRPSSAISEPEPEALEREPAAVT